MTTLPSDEDPGLPIVITNPREGHGYTGLARDCVTRSISIAGDLDYAEVYDDLTTRQQAWSAAARTKAARAFADRSSTTARTGVHAEVYTPYLDELGWYSMATMGFGTGTVVHLAAGELPPGRLLVRCSGHLTAVLDGEVHDTHDPTKGGTRAVYKLWSPDPIDDPAWLAWLADRAPALLNGQARR